MSMRPRENLNYSVFLLSFRRPFPSTTEVGKVWEAGRQGGLRQRRCKAQARLQQQKIRLEQKVPEIERALSGVKLLEEKEGTEEGMDVDYELADNVYARAKVKGQRSVYLWLGASVMLEYWLDEARSLLERNLANAKESLEKNRRDMDTLRESITITEVSIARVYNHDVQKRRSSQQKEPSQ